MAAIYTAKTYGTTIKWAIAGRRRNALEDVRRELILINPDLKNLPLIIADSSDPQSLVDMVTTTKVCIIILFC